MNFKKKNNDVVLEEVWCESGAGAGLPLLKYPLLEQTGIVEHCFTTRYFVEYYRWFDWKVCVDSG